MFELGVGAFFATMQFHLMVPLGSSLWSVISTLRTLQHLFPQVEVKFDLENASTTPVILHLRPYFDLLFSAYHQRLHTICLRKPRDPHPPMALRYKDSIICRGDEPLVKIKISRTFGPTYPGDELRYPGVWFSFDDDTISEGLKGSSSHAITDNRSKEVKRIIVTQKDAQDVGRDPLDEVNLCPVMYGDISRAIVKVGLHLVCMFLSLLFCIYRSTMALSFTSTGLLALLLRLFTSVWVKQLHRISTLIWEHHQEYIIKMTSEWQFIHPTRSLKTRVRAQIVSHVFLLDSLLPWSLDFYNYFSHGIDFLISGQTHLVRKIILHSNVVSYNLRFLCA